MLTERFSREFYRNRLKNGAAFRIFPAAADRAAWEERDDVWFTGLRREVIAAAERFAAEPLPELTASLYRDYRRTGCRARFERPYFHRRDGLGTLVLAECFEHRGRFIDRIVDAIWAILGEPEWTLPAHAWYPAGDLPDPDHPYVDLMRSQTAMILAQPFLLLGDELDRNAPLLRRRVCLAVKERVFQPLLVNPERHGWLDGRNNWGPWCAANTLAGALTLLSDREELLELVMMFQQTADRFFNGYPDDGGCDEGAGYWRFAAAELFLLLDQLDAAAGIAEVWQEPKLRRMAEFIITAIPVSGQVLSMADCPARLSRRLGFAYHFGERTGCRELEQLALSCRTTAPAGIWDGNLLQYLLYELFTIPATATVQPCAPPCRALLPELQLAVFREEPLLDAGMVLAIKGGHNDESHNHLDIGQFELFCDGRAVIVDPGKCTYDDKTFSPRRYDNWVLNSAGHNPPRFNGFGQLPGRQFAAGSFTPLPSGTGIEVEYAAAYAAEAGVERLFRRAELRGAEVEIIDRAVIRNASSLVLSFYSPVKPESGGTGIRFPLSGGGAVELTVAGVCRPEITPLPLTDPGLCESWGEMLYRLDIAAELPPGTNKWRFRFIRIPAIR